MPGCSDPTRADDNQVVVGLRRLIDNLPHRFARLHDDSRRHAAAVKQLCLLLKCIAQRLLVLRCFRNSEERSLGLERYLPAILPDGLLLSVDCVPSLQIKIFIGYNLCPVTSVDNDRCANQRQRHKREPNFWSGEILRSNQRRSARR